MKKLGLSLFTCLLILILNSQNLDHYDMGAKTEKPFSLSSIVPSFQHMKPDNNNDNRVGTFIDFDYYPAATSFMNAYPLRVYGGFGLVFLGPSSQDGGAVLDEGSALQVTGYSAPNFLAFNTSQSYPSGGIPIGPEEIRFYQPVSYVEIMAGDWRHITGIMSWLLSMRSWPRKLCSCSVLQKKRYGR